MNASRPPAWREVAGVAAVVLAWLAASAWLRPLQLPDEGRYVGVTWEMLRSGDWLTPTLDGLPYFHKPPLFYWITAGSMALFGLDEAAARAAPLTLRGWRDSAKPRLIEALGAAGLAALAHEHGFAQNRHLLGAYGFDNDAARYRSRMAGWLAAAADGDVLMVHPSLLCSDDDRHREARCNELALLDSEAFGAMLQAAQVRLCAMSRMLRHAPAL